MSSNTEKKDQLMEALQTSNSGGEQMAEVLMELALKAFQAVDEMTSSSLKRVLKRIICYPMQPEHFQALEIVPKKELTAKEKELYEIGTASKDVYVDLMAFQKNVELIEKRLAELENKEKKDE